MKWFYNLRIATKLIIGFIIVAFIAGIVGVVGIINVHKINNMDTDLYKNHTATMPDLTNIANNYQKERAILRDLLLVKDSDKRQDSISKFKGLDEDIDTSMAHFEMRIEDPEVRKNLDDLKKLMDSFRQFKDKEIVLITSNHEEQAIDGLYNEGTTIEKLVSLKTNLAKSASDSNSTSANIATMTMLM